MKVFITGINGFIASHLAQFLSDQGNLVYGSTTKLQTQYSNNHVRHIYNYNLGDSIDSSLFQDIQTVIYCAHNFEPGSLNKNIQGTIAIAEAAWHQGVQKQIFISSLSLLRQMPFRNMGKQSTK